MKRLNIGVLLLFLGTMVLQCNEPAGNKVNEKEGVAMLASGNDQVYNVNFLIGNMADQNVYLAAFNKSSYSLIDSTLSTNGSFYFSFLADQHPGTYRVYFGRPEFNQRDAAEKLFIEFIWCKESFSVSADYLDIRTSVAFENSEENDVLGDFREYETDYEEKMSAMYPLIDRYPQKDEFFAEAKTHFMTLQEEREEFILALIEEHADLYVKDLISSYLSLILKPELKGMDRMAYLRYHFFDKAPIDKPGLIYSPVYNYKIIEYLSLYRDKNNSYSQQEDAFIEATDIIMANVSADADLRSFVVEYLLEGFNSFQMEKVQSYIAENYVDETCTTDVVELAMQRVEGYKKMELGAIAADFKIRSIDNEAIVLSKLKNDYTVVIFWASHCEHCVRMMSKLKDWYLSDIPDNVEIVAISIDTVKTNWTSYVEQMKLPWINVHEPLGWEGKSASDYNIYATPTIFVLDRKRKILAKPITFRELKRDLVEVAGSDE